MLVGLLSIIVSNTLKADNSLDKNNVLKKQNEYDLRVLNEAYDCNFDNLIVTNMFDGYIVLPSNYILYPFTQNDEVHFSTNRYGRNYYLSSNVYIGNNQEALKKRIEYTRHHLYVDSYKKKYDAFEVLMRQLRVQDMYELLIYKSNQYILISLKSKEVLNEILNIYTYLKEKPCAIDNRHLPDILKD